MNSYYCCYWCHSLYTKERVEEYGKIDYHRNGFKVLSGFCQSTNHQNRSSRCELYGITDDFVYKTLDERFYFKQEKLLQFLNMCQKKICRRKMWLQKLQKVK